MVYQLFFFQITVTLIIICSFAFMLAVIAVFVGSVRRDRIGVRVVRWIERKRKGKESQRFLYRSNGTRLATTR